MKDGVLYRKTYFRLRISEIIVEKVAGVIMTTLNIAALRDLRKLLSGLHRKGFLGMLFFFFNT